MRRGTSSGAEAAPSTTPDDGYRISTFKLDGKIVKISKTAKSYTIRNVKATHRIDVTFEKDPNAPEKPDTSEQPSQPDESGRPSSSDAQNPNSDKTDNGEKDNGEADSASESKSVGVGGATGNDALEEDGE